MTTAITEYSPIEAGLADLRQRYAGVAWDLRTVAGNDAARKARKELVSLRTSLEDKRKALKAPVLAQAKLIDEEAKRITGELLAIETPIDEQIKADEARREAERQARIEAERRRVAAIRAELDSITAKAAGAMRLRKSTLAIGVLDELLAVALDGEMLAEYAGEAEKILADAVTAVRSHVAALQEQEAEAARIAAEREALERAKAEAAERERVERERLAEQERVARVTREAEEARLAAERAAIERERQEQERAAREQQERLDAEAKAERDRIAAAEAEVSRQRADVERREREQREREEAAEAERMNEAAAKARAEEIAAERQARASKRPSDDEIIDALSLHYRVHESTVIGWLLAMDLEAASARMVAAL